MSEFQKDTGYPNWATRECVLWLENDGYPELEEMRDECEGMDRDEAEDWFCGELASRFESHVDSSLRDMGLESPMIQIAADIDKIDYGFIFENQCEDLFEESDEEPDSEDGEPEKM